MTTQMKSYRDTRAVSNSVMTLYEGDFSKFVSYWVKGIPYGDKKEDYLTLGSAVDTLLTRPEQFEEMFIVFKETVPTGQMLTFCNSIAILAEESGLLAVEAIPANFYNSAYETVGFKRDSIEKVKEKFEPFKPYVQFLLNSSGKAVLSLEQASKAHAIVQELKDNKYTGPIVNVKTKKTLDLDIQVYNQLEVFQGYNVKIEDQTVLVPLKGAIDRVIVDHKKKKIFPMDFKSSYAVGSFDYSYQKYNYFRQGSFYTFLLKEWAIENDLKDYEIAPFLFVVCSTTGGAHYMYKMTPKELTAAEKGGTLRNGRDIKGWRQILMEIAYHQKHNEWNYPYEALTNGGIVTLNVFREDKPAAFPEISVGKGLVAYYSGSSGDGPGAYYIQLE